MKRFPQKDVRFDSKELETDLGMGNRIFVGSSCDMFANDIPEEWILQTMNYARRFKNRYLYQSKNPYKMVGLKEMFGDLDAVCTTIETNRMNRDVMGSTPCPEARAYWLGQFPYNRYLTIEPIMDFDLGDMIEIVRVCNPVQVNIGADSGNNGLPEPPKEKLLALIDELKKFTIIDQKRNLSRLLK
jgi:protein gp37